MYVEKKFSPNVFGHLGKQLAEKQKFSFKIYCHLLETTNKLLQHKCCPKGFIVWMILLHEILGNICMVIINFSVDEGNFEINFSFLIKLFYYMIKTIRIFERVNDWLVVWCLVSPAIVFWLMFCQYRHFLA